MRQLAVVSAVLLSALGRLANAYPAIEDYHPKTDVAYLSNLALDLREMDILLKTGDEQAFQQAHDIYQHGGYAAPHANLQVQEPLPYALTKGDVLEGLAIDGKPVTVTLEKDTHEKGYTGSIRVIHSSNCHRTGLPNTDNSRCLMEKGPLTLAGKTGEIGYSYDPAVDIKSDHNLRSMSLNANAKFRPNGNNHEKFYKDFEKYANFFGRPDFANVLIEAAFNNKTFTIEKLGIDWDFGVLTPRARRSFIVHTSAYMIVGLFVMRELETAVNHCDRRCPAADCSQDAFHAMDGAVALYTGELYHQTKKGNFGFGLAENMCPEFRTCGHHASSTNGHAKVNIDVFTLFKEMQKNLAEGHCLEAKKNKETIAYELKVPIIQASLLSLHMAQEEDTDETRAERTVFTAAALPLLYSCDKAITRYITLHIAPTKSSVGSETFDIVKQHYEDSYRCMVVGCLDVGGIWDATAKDYVEGAETCYVPPEESKVESYISFTHVLLFAFGAIGALALIYYIMRRRRLAKFRHERDIFDYSDDEDDFDDEDSLSS